MLTDPARPAHRHHGSARQTPEGVAADQGAAEGGQCVPAPSTMVIRRLMVSWIIPFTGILTLDSAGMT